MSVLKKYIIFIIFLGIIFISGCSSNDEFEYDNIDEFTNSLIKQSKPDIAVYNYLEYVQDKSPDEQLYITHIDLIKKWKYVADEVDNDTIKNCNDMITNNDFIGDCDDSSVIMMSICNAIGLEAIFVLGTTEDFSGHVWVEVKICNIDEYDNFLKTRFDTIFDKNTNITERDSVVWLQLDPHEMLKNYTIRYIVEEDKLIKKEEF